MTACQQCFRVFHPDCIPNGRRKFQEFKKTSILYDQQKLASKDDSTNISMNSISLSSDSDDLNSTNELSTYNLPLNNNGQNESTLSNESEYDETLCGICNISKLDDGCNLEKSELNYLLKYVIHRIQSWVINNLCQIK